MGIDAVGRTGNQGCKVFSGNLVQALCFVRENGSDVGDLVFQVTPKDFDVEDIAEFDAVEVVEHGCTAQSGVAGKNRVSSFAANGKSSSKEVSDAFSRVEVSVP